MFLKMPRAKRSSGEIIGILTVMATLVSGSCSIRIVKVLVPPRVQAGETVQLSCHFDLEGKKLYSLNWWRGSEQFYQFSPNNSEQMLVYDSPGIEIDQAHSGSDVVVLRNVSRATAGKYKCEVLADYPSFEKDSEITHMEVIEVPDRPPTVSLTRLQWSPGQVLSANCTSPGARPPPDLHWYINGDKLPPQHSHLLSPTASSAQQHALGGTDHGDIHLLGIKSKKDIPQHISPRTSELSLVLRPAHFRSRGQAVLTCEAALRDLYRKSTDVTLTLPGFRSPAPSQKLYGCAYTCEGPHLAVLVILTLIAAIEIFI